MVNMLNFWWYLFKMKLRDLINLSVFYGVVIQTSAGKRSRFFVPVIDESDLAGLGDETELPDLSGLRTPDRLVGHPDLSGLRVDGGRPDLSDLGKKDGWLDSAMPGNPLDIFDEHMRQILADLVTTGDPFNATDEESTNNSADSEQQLPEPSPSCITYPKKFVGFEPRRSIGFVKPRKSGIQKRSRYKLSEPLREPSTQDIIAQLDDVIAEQEMDKRSRIELLSYLDAAIKNKNIELNLELRHLAKEEEILNLRDQSFHSYLLKWYKPFTKSSDLYTRWDERAKRADMLDFGDADRNVMVMNSNIAQLNKRIKDLDERIVCMNRLKEERTAQEAAIWRDTMDKSASYNVAPDKIGDNIAMAVSKVVGTEPASRVKVALPNVIPGVLGSNLGVVPGAVPVPGALPDVLSGSLPSPYVDPSVYAALQNAQQNAWWPVVAPQQWDRMFHPKWGDHLPQLQQNNRGFPPLIPFHQRPQSDTSDLVEYED